MPLCSEFTPQALQTWCFAAACNTTRTVGFGLGPVRRTQCPVLDIFVINGLSHICLLLPCWCAELSISDHGASSWFTILPRHQFVVSYPQREVTGLCRNMRWGCIVAWHDVRIYFRACVCICAFAYVYLYLRTLMPPLQNVPDEFHCCFFFAFSL